MNKIYKYYTNSLLVILFIFMLGGCSKVEASTWNSLSNPIIQPGNTNFDSQAVLDSFILKENSQYKLWYTLSNGSGFRIGYATSPNGINSWSFLGTPILSPSSLNNWEKDVFNPSIIKVQDKYLMFYTSSDSTHWTYGLDRSRLRYAISNDGINWIPQGWILYGTLGKWDEGGINRGFSVLYKDNKYHLWYAGTNQEDLGTHPYWRIGYATSSDGVTWTKENNGNPVIEPTKAWELNNVSYPTVIFDNNQYKMWYSAATGDLPTQVAFATSIDGIHWNKSSNQNPVSFTTTNGFDSMSRMFTSILKEDDHYKSWYSGFDGRSWKIGYATMDIPKDIALPVPQMKQRDAAWGNLPYDSASTWAKTSTTIGGWGCALTSASMVLNYYGITHSTDGTAMTPASLNKLLLKTPNGYVNGGVVNWITIAALTKTLKPYNPDFAYDALEYKKITSSDRYAVLRSSLLENEPGILDEGNHFITATGISGENITINDPYYDRTLLADGYNNSFAALILFVPSYTNLSYIVVYTDPTTDFLVTNAAGQKAGFTNGTVYTDIAGSSANVVGGIVNPETQEASPSKRVIEIPQPEDGNYLLSVSSTSTSLQTYTASILSYDRNGKVTTRNVQGYVTNRLVRSENLLYSQTPK